MRGSVSGAAALAGALLFAGQGDAEPAVTAVATVMRAAPNSHSAAVQTIPANAEIDVQGCGQGWCSASWRNLGGFVRTSALAGPPPGAPPYAVAPPPVVVAPPAVVIAPSYGWGWHGGYGYYGGGYWHHY